MISQFILYALVASLLTKSPFDLYPEFSTTYHLFKERDGVDNRFPLAMKSYDADISLLSCPASVADAPSASARPSFLAKGAKCREKNNGDDYAAQLRADLVADSLSSFT